jgi:hypothetical protein
LHKMGYKVIAGCGPSRDFDKWLGEQKAMAIAFTLRWAMLPTGRPPPMPSAKQWPNTAPSMCW